MFSIKQLSYVAILAATALNAQATVLDFETPGKLFYNDTAGVGYFMPLVEGLVFTNLGLYTPLRTTDGYYNSIVSGTNVGYSEYALDVTISRAPGYNFTFSSIWLGSAFNHGMNIQITGIVNGVETYSRLVTVDSDAASFFEFNWDVDSVTFSAYGGISSGFEGDGTNIVFDDLIYTAVAVPEPSSYAMIGLGLGMLGFAARRRKSA